MADAIVIDGHLLVVADSVTISFQRYPEDALRGPAEVPRSYGALPVELSSLKDGFLPVRPGEGIRLGLSARGQQERTVHVGWLGPQGLDDTPRRWSAMISSPQRLHGLHRPKGTFCPFILAPLSPRLLPCHGVTISVDDLEAIQVRFVGAPEFEARAGRPAPSPMVPDDCYGGWRLP